MSKSQQIARAVKGLKGPNIQHSGEKSQNIQIWKKEVCGKVLIEKNAYKSVKTALLLSNVIDEDHQNNLYVV